MEKVWIDQDLCTGDGLCEEIAPAVFRLKDDGLAYVVNSEGEITTSIDGKQSAEISVEVPAYLADAVQEAADECPGECIFIERC
jgi:ferredoxin